MQETKPKIYKNFILTGHIEGVSYLVLLLIAMPLKYMMGQPEAVTIVGYLHGFLFILYCVLLALTMVKLKWSFRNGAIAFILSLIPFGTFYLNRIK